ncbi:MAG: hypothetical protein ACRCX2_29135 [Paraclostridium sp.]
MNFKIICNKCGNTVEIGEKFEQFRSDLKIEIYATIWETVEIDCKNCGNNACGE